MPPIKMFMTSLYPPSIFRYRHSKDRAQRMVVIPRYEPVFVEPNMKQYEVQVSY